MAPDRTRTPSAPEHHPSDSGDEFTLHPLVAALVALSFTVGGVALLFFAPGAASLVTAVMAMVIALACFIGFIGHLLGGHNGP